MTDAWALIIATLITTVAGVVGAGIKQLKELRKENRNDHGMVMLHLKTVRRSVENVGDKVQSVSDRLDNHIDWHLDAKK
jgi:hypothetical protein